LAAATAALIQRVLNKRFLTVDTRRTLRRLCPGKTDVVLVFYSLVGFRIFLFIFLFIDHGTYETVMKCKHKLDHMKCTVKIIKVGYHDR